MLILICRKQEVFRRNTNTDFTEGRIQVAMYFITQATPDTWRKLWRLQIGPQTPLSTLVKEDFKVYNKWDLMEEAIRIKKKHSFWLLWFNHHLENAPISSPRSPVGQQNIPQDLPSQIRVDPEIWDTLVAGRTKCVPPVKIKPGGNTPGRDNILYNLRSWGKSKLSSANS